MHIKSVETAGFGKLPDDKMIFGEGLTVIKGPNEAGKSFTIRAICQCLYGDAATTDRKVRELCRKWGSIGDFFVRLELEDSGKTFIVERDYENKRNTFRVKGEKEVKDKKKVAQFIGDLLGLPTEKAFLATACIRQEEVEALDEERTSIRSIIEEKIAGSGSDTEKLLKLLNKKTEELRSKSGKKGKLIELEAQIEALDEELSEKKERLAQLVNNKRELARVKSELEESRRLLADRERALENNRKYIEAQAKMERLDGDLDLAQNDLERYKEAKKKLDDSAKSLSELNRELERIVEEIDRAECFLEADGAYTSMNEEYARLEERRKRAKELDARIAELEKELEGMHAVDPTELRNAISLPREISSLESALEGQLFGIEVKPEADVAYAITADGKKVEGPRAEAHREVMIDFPGIASVHFKNLSGGERPLVEEIARKQDAIKRILEKYGVMDIEDLERLNEKQVENRAERERLERERDHLLGGDSLDELESTLREKRADLEKLKEKRDSLMMHALPEEGLREKKKTKEELIEKKQRLESDMSECRGTLKALGEDEQKLRERVNYCAKELAVARAALDDLRPYQCSATEFGRLEGEVEELRERVKGLEQREIVLKDRISQEMIGEEDLAEVEEKLNHQRIKLEKLRRRYDVNLIIAENIEWARQKSVSGFSKGIEKRMGELLSVITGGKYNRVEVAGDLGVKVYSEEKGDFIDLENKEELYALSSGTLDQIYLAARLAILESITGDRKPPLILDDTFVSFDDMGRKLNAFRLLEKIAQDRQVLYFTCHECPSGLQIVSI